MGYTGDSVMDWGWFVGGFAEGMLYVPPPGSSQKPTMIPWSDLLDDDDEKETDDDDE